MVGNAPFLGGDPEIPNIFLYLPFDIIEQHRKESRKMDLKVPPQNIEAEKAVLGAIMLNNDALNQIMGILEPHDFYKEAHGSLFRLMVDLYHKEEPVDVVTLSQPTGKSPAGEKPVGPDYLVELLESVSTSAGVKYHAELIKDLSIRRSLIGECARISLSCFERVKETDDVLEEAEQAIYQLASQRHRQQFRHLGMLVGANIKEVEEKSQQPGGLPGLSTGYGDFDYLTAGLQPGELIIIAARPSVGKTALALNMAYHVARRQGKAVAVFSLEMSEKQVAMRLLSLDARINFMRLRRGALQGDEWSQLIESADRLSILPIYVDDTSANTVLEMKSKIRRLIKTEDVGMIIVDYLQLMHGRSRRSEESRQMEISEISRSLKDLSKDLDLPVVALSQLNRRIEQREKKRPQLSDLRESGAIEQDADVIAFIFKEDTDDVYSPETQPVVEIDVAKNRNGPTGHFKLTFLKEYARFESYAKE